MASVPDRRIHFPRKVIIDFYLEILFTTCWFECDCYSLAFTTDINEAVFFSSRCKSMQKFLKLAPLLGSSCFRCRKLWHVPGDFSTRLSAQNLHCPGQFDIACLADIGRQPRLIINDIFTCENRDESYSILLDVTVLAHYYHTLSDLQVPVPTSIRCIMTYTV